jgi:DNA-binding NarL/FixJ family response regulator
MSPAIARRAMELLKGSKPVVPVQNNPTESQLSDREMEILKEVVKGYNHQEIAENSSLAQTPLELMLIIFIKNFISILEVKL